MNLDQIQENTVGVIKSVVYFNYTTNKEKKNWVAEEITCHNWLIFYNTFNIAISYVFCLQSVSILKT